MLDLVYWSIFIGLTPAAVGLVWELISAVADLIGLIIASSHGGQGTPAFTRPPNGSSSAILRARSGSHWERDDP
jgi:hypothetical protein